MGDPFSKRVFSPLDPLAQKDGFFFHHWQRAHLNTHIHTPTKSPIPTPFFFSFSRIPRRYGVIVLCVRRDDDDGGWDAVIVDASIADASFFFLHGRVDTDRDTDARGVVRGGLSLSLFFS